MKREFCESDCVATREFNTLHNKIYDLEIEIAKLNRDKKRLDWLSDVTNIIGNVQLPTECVINNPHSLRSAIDEAMTLTA